MLYRTAHDKLFGRYEPFGLFSRARSFVLLVRARVYASVTDDGIKVEMKNGFKVKFVANSSLYVCIPNILRNELKLYS